MHEQRRDDRVTKAHRTAAERDEPSTDPLRASLGRPESVLALQQLVGNAEVTRRIQRAAVEDVLSAPGRPLDESVRTDMETRLGADFSDVRVHTDHAAHESAESVNARAYTSGAHIVFQRGRYDTASDTGRETLAHELTHVVQQRSGPVAGTDTGDGLAVSDPTDRFEREAERVASQAMGGGVTDPVTATGPSHGTPVARMISTKDFRKNTNKIFEWSRGDKITQVENALAAYHALPPGNYTGRLTQLGHVVQEANIYINSSNNDSRKAEARKLLDKATGHQAIYTALVAADQPANSNTNTFRHLIQAQDAIQTQVVAADAGPDDELSHFSQRVLERMNALRGTLQQPEMQALMNDDLQKLTAMSSDQNVPQTTRDILTELLAHQGQIAFQPANMTGSGTRRTAPNQYTVANPPNHPGGTAERLGSLAHELTHVDAGEAYNNTDILLLYGQGLNNNQVVQLATDRRATLDNLINLLDTHQGLTWDQRDLFGKKLKYAGEKSLLKYAADFRVRDLIDVPTYNQLRQIDALTAGNSGLLVEYDTVINQLLIYLHMWGVPQDSPLYVEVLRVAEQQRQERLAG